jgi:hypothetical protein
MLLIKSCGMNNDEEKSIEKLETNGISEPEIILPGKIIQRRTQENRFLIYDNSNISKKEFEIGKSNESRYSGHSWMNTMDNFVATEYIREKDGPTIKGHLIKTDINNKFLEYIYKVNDGEYAAGAYFSNNDSLLLFTMTKKGDKKVNPLEGLIRMESIYVMSYYNREIIKKIDNIGSSPSFSLNESPWIYDGTAFIYSINYDNVIAHSDELTKRETKSGIYIYSFADDQLKLLIPDGNFGICSPVDYIIAYKLGNSIFCYNLNDNTKHLVYSGKSKEKIVNIHWTPDGKYIYVASYIFRLGEYDFESSQKLIEVETGKEISFKKINHGFNSYSWK